MKTRLFFLSALAAAPGASAAVVAHWNFNDLSSPGGVPSNANVTTYVATSGSGSLNLVGWTSRAGATTPHGISNFGGSLVNALGADVAGQGLALQAGTTSISNNGATAVFAFDLTGLENPVFGFATQRSGTGFNSNQLAWSTDGTTYTDFGTAYVPAAAYAVQSFDLSTVDALDNEATVFLRITFSGGTNVSGNNRLDNIQINAAVLVPEPSTAALAASALLFLRRRRA